MAVRMSDATINHGISDNLNKTSVDTTLTGNSTSDFSGIGTTVGITENMAKNISDAIEQYKQEITDTLSQLRNVDSQNAFRGTGITEAISRFIEGVKYTANEYLQAVAESQNEIVYSVKQAYQQQDTDISGNIKGDEATVTSSRPI